MNLPRLAVERPVATLMALLSVMVIGGLALARLPLAFLPSVDLPFINITIPYPNSNPTQIEKEIARPIEEALSTLPGVRKLISRSTADAAEFELGFSWGHDLDVVRMLVSEKIHQVRPDLPEGIGDIVILSLNASDIPVVEGRIAAEGVDLSRNFDLLESRILNPIRRVPGVARVDLHGVAPREVRIELVRDRVKEHAVDIGRLFDRLRGATSNVVLGQVSENGRRYSARALGAFDDLQRLRELPIDERGLRLGQVADITYEEPPIAFGRHLEGDYAVALSVYKESTANTVEVVRAVMRVIQKDIDRDPLLQGVRLLVWDDQAEQIVSSINGLRLSGLVGGLLAICVLYFFLRRFDSTLIVSLSIPFSLMAACGVLYFMGKNLNILSMMGLMLGVGMLVDNAIVVLESIDRRHRVHREPRRAALEGGRDVALAVTASTLTTVIVFLPLIVGASTQLSTWLEEVGITITIALLCSLASSLTLIPLLAVRLLRRRAPVRNPAMEWLEERYVAVLGWTLRRKGWTLALVIAGLGVGLAPFFAGWVETAQFAGVVHERLFLSYEFADFVYKSDAEAAVNQVEAYLRSNRERFHAGTIYSFFGENEAGTLINLARKDLGDREVKELRESVRAGLPEIPGVRVFFQEEAEDGGGSNYFAVKLFGQDSAQLQRLSEITERRLASIEGVRDISTPARKGRQEIQVSIDRERARQLGLTAKDVSDIFSFTLGGLRLPRFNTGRREVETWLELRLEDRQNLDDLRRLQFTTREGRPVSLGDIASFEVIKRPQEVLREGRKVRTEVKAVYEGEDWEGAKKRIEEQMNALDLPPGTTWSWDDRIIERGREDQQMMVNFILALILVYIVMASLFESVTQPFAILFSIPFALPGVAWFLTATRTPFNLMGQIGLLMLVGIVVNNGIVLLDHMNQLRRAGMGIEEAILQTGRDRLRAILMTAATTIVGLVPMALGSSGVGDAYYYPLARTVMGGLMSSTVLTLVVLPYINLGVERGAAWAARVWAASAPPQAAVAESQTALLG
jgi:HAE1 family hydrophobic/amphiphilic exporter-1